MLDQLLYRIVEGEDERADILPISGECPPPMNELDHLLHAKYPVRAEVTQARAVWELIERELDRCNTSNELVYAWSFIKPLLRLVSAEAAQQITLLSLQRLANARRREFRESVVLVKPQPPKGETYGGIDI